MYMSYTTNPKMPKVRRDAVLYAYKYGIRASARYFGFSPSAVHKWKLIMDKRGYGEIPTKSSKPKHHPKQLSPELQYAIFSKRIQLRRAAEVVHESLRRDGVVVSLASVKRTIDRTGLLKKRSPWKKQYLPVPRPLAEKPGDLIQVDTIHILESGYKRIYVLTLIDVYSRRGYARAYSKISMRIGADFVRRAQVETPFKFNMVQSDNGGEFGSKFTELIPMSHRHTRVRKPNDNAHIERFNRTLREECLNGLEPSVIKINKVLKKYLEEYNSSRLHFGIGLRAPNELLNC